jgi:large subunit ribosomal protein L32
MANPKRRKSLSKQKMRQFANRWRAPTLTVCGECGTPVPGHVACPSCGYYRDRKVFHVGGAEAPAAPEADGGAAPTEEAA